MVSDAFIAVCPNCGAKNRVPRARWGEAARCGKCGTSIHVKGAYPDQTVIVHDWDFRDEVLDFPGPVLVEFFSPG